MKKIYTIAIILALSLLHFSTISMPIYAESKSEVTENEYLDMNFNDSMDLFFSDPSGFQIYDKNHNEITNYFYQQYKQYHNSGNYTMLSTYFSNNVSTFHYPSIIKPNPISTYAFSTQTYEHIYVVYPTAKVFTTERSWEVKMLVEGQFNYNDNTYEIVSYTRPHLSKDWDNAKGIFALTMEDESINVWNRVDYLEINASCRFHVTATVSIGDWPIGQDTYTNYYSSGLFRIEL